MPEALLVAAGHQAGARGAAIRPADVAAGEAHAVPGQRIDVRRGNLRVALAAQLAVAEVVGDDDEDVRALCLGRGRRRRQDEPSAGQGGEQAGQVSFHTDACVRIGCSFTNKASPWP